MWGRMSGWCNQILITIFRVWLPRQGDENTSDNLTEPTLTPQYRVQIHTYTLSYIHCIDSIPTYYLKKIVYVCMYVLGSVSADVTNIDHHLSSLTASAGWREYLWQPDETPIHTHPYIQTYIHTHRWYMHVIVCVLFQMREFRSGSSRVLITTDLLARGIDVQQVSLVINYDLPPNRLSHIHTYIHTYRHIIHTYIHTYIWSIYTVVTHKQ